MSLPCLAPGCQSTRREGQIFCAPHWYKVPKELRDRIWRSWRAVQNGHGTMEEHRPLVREAVEFLREKPA